MRNTGNAHLSLLLPAVLAPLLPDRRAAGALARTQHQQILESVRLLAQLQHPGESYNSTGT
jgi:hypothetical protein